MAASRSPLGGRRPRRGMPKASGGTATGGHSRRFWQMLRAREATGGIAIGHPGPDLASASQLSLLRRDLASRSAKGALTPDRDAAVPSSGAPEGDGVILATAARLRQQLRRREGHDIVGNCSVLCRDVLCDSALDRLPRYERASNFYLEINQHQQAVLAGRFGDRAGEEGELLRSRPILQEVVGIGTGRGEFGIQAAQFAFANAARRRRSVLLLQRLEDR